MSKEGTVAEKVYSSRDLERGCPMQWEGDYFKEAKGSNHVRTEPAPETQSFLEQDLN